MIKYLENENLKELTEKGTYLVDFYADWCGPCKMLSSILETMEDVNIIKVNTDIHQDLAIQYGIMSIPTVIFIKNGIEVKKIVGFISEEEIREILESME